MIKYIEVNFENEESICILSKRIPTIDDIKTFCKNDMLILGVNEIFSINEISKEEAHLFYDMEKEKEYPILS